MMDKTEKLKDKLDTIPNLPGIYKMLDKSGRIIYIGKSISLRSRVRSYFTQRHEWSKIEKMLALIDDIEYEVTDTHLEARLLECSLIKRIQPIFNSQFKNDRKYVYLRVEDYNIHSALTINHDGDEDSFGPFRSMSILLELIDALKNLYPIRRLDGGYEFSYKVMPTRMDEEEFIDNRTSLLEILTDYNKLGLFMEALEKLMAEAAGQYKYETATYYRNLISYLKYVEGSIYNHRELYNKELVLKLETEYGYKLFLVYKGQIINIKSLNKLDNEPLEEFIEKSRRKSPLNMVDKDEKKNLDFINIIYSEIKSLPEENVIILD